jgi:serine/threonine protein kinase
MSSIIKLQKTGGSRFPDVETFRVVCNDPSEVELFFSLKDAREDGFTDEEFVHVAKGKLLRFQKSCIVKVNASNSKFLFQELKALNLLLAYPHVVQYLCHFTCKDHTRKWKNKLNAQTFACDPSGKRSLTFIVMEYIKFGSINKLLKESTSKELLLSLFLQTAMIMLELGKLYNILHGDLHTGNILIKKSKKKYFTYMRKYKIPLFGYRVVLIDFGRSKIYKSTLADADILDDIAIVFEIYRNHIKYRFRNLSECLSKILLQDLLTISFDSFLNQIIQCFDVNSETFLMRKSI